jgi:hypothetical protein
VSGPLLQIAARIDAAATELRTRAARIGHDTANARWSSDGARRCYARLGALTDDLLGCARDLDALADQFRRAAARRAAGDPR